MDLHTVEAIHQPMTRTQIGPIRPGDAFLAGGTWLFSEAQPAIHRLIDITTLGWVPITVGQDGLKIAGSATIQQISGLSQSLPSVRPDWVSAPLFHQCCTALLASFKIWHSATIGGNICLSFPAGAMISLAAALDATALIWRPDGNDYHVPITQFVTGAGQNVLSTGDLLREIVIPASALRGRTAYRKLAPSPLGRSGIVVIGRRDIERDGGTVTICITAATTRPIVFRFPQPPSANELRAAHAALSESDWTRDAHGDPDWRAAMALHLADQIRSELA